MKIIHSQHHHLTNRGRNLLIGVIVGSIFLIGGVFYFFYSWGEKESPGVAEAKAHLLDTGVDAAQRLDEPLIPISRPENLDAQKVALGQLLFRDARLSKDGTVSCASCHDLTRGGVDHLPQSLGVGKAKGSINAPTVYNSSLNFRQFWDGRAATLEEQAAGPILNPVEMASNWDQVLRVLNEDERMLSRFHAIYNGPPTPERVQNAIAEFERSLLTPSRMDRWLRGESNALSDEELKGYRLFKQYGCVACHQGENVGGNLFQRFGIMANYFAGRATTEADLGRFNVTKREEDKFVFKVPGLRNVAITAPYFHDASVNTLEEAVTIMGRYQLGIDLPKEDTQSITRFLHALTGEQLQ
ncbi:MAG: cytochrome-c peroxidase [Zoogloeaceae bacterium]|jgi:cytochrome c peroxidase|nr:cytochrome-c peroxidase [Zoogloeaceae bacterium]